VHLLLLKQDFAQSEYIHSRAIRLYIEADIKIEKVHVNHLIKNKETKELKDNQIIDLMWIEKKIKK